MNKMEETWFRNFLADQQLHQLLETLDADLAEEGCYCGGKLHRAYNDRKARGVRNGTNAIAFVAIKTIASVSMRV